MRSSAGGRVGKNYQMFALFNFIILFVIGLVDTLAGSPGVLGMLYGLAVLIPSIAVSVRRLHDTDRSGWWFLIALVPLIGIIVDRPWVIGHCGTAGYSNLNMRRTPKT